ncbi:MAG: hypothetical protein J2O48_10020 [Solirubrobacterales bacterium]|nr:hypothetical protein [Solirubrobacterales bacterium]
MDDGEQDPQLQRVRDAQEALFGALVEVNNAYQDLMCAGDGEATWEQLERLAVVWREEAEMTRFDQHVDDLVGYDAADLYAAFEHSLALAFSPDDRELQLALQWEKQTTDGLRIFGPCMEYDDPDLPEVPPRHRERRSKRGLLEKVWIDLVSAADIGLTLFEESPGGVPEVTPESACEVLRQFALAEQAAEAAAADLTLADWEALYPGLAAVRTIRRSLVLATAIVPERRALAASYDELATRFFVATRLMEGKSREEAGAELRQRIAINNLTSDR